MTDTAKTFRGYAAMADERGAILEKMRYEEAADEIERLNAIRDLDALRIMAGQWEAECANNKRLRAPLQNVDALDWSHLMSWVPESGHGKFWRAVFAELRNAYEAKARNE